MGCTCLILMFDSVYRMLQTLNSVCLMYMQSSEKDNSLIHNVDGISEKIITITF